MSKGNTFETELLALTFNATTIANLAINATSGPLTVLYVSLHTADPGEGGDQTTSEANYTGYDRVAVNRNSGGWTVSSGSAVNAALIEFPESAGVPNTITHFAVGTADLPSAGKILYSGVLTDPLDVVTGIQPRFEAGGLSVTED